MARLAMLLVCFTLCALANPATQASAERPTTSASAIIITANGLDLQAGSTPGESLGSATATDSCGAAVAELLAWGEETAVIDAAQHQRLLAECHRRAVLDHQRPGLSSPPFLIIFIYLCFISIILILKSGNKIISLLISHLFINFILFVLI
jgi:hypothetical protein